MLFRVVYCLRYSMKLRKTKGNSIATYECYQKAADISPLVARELTTTPVD
jgi:hypothetical protein